VDEPPSAPSRPVHPAPPPLREAAPPAPVSPAEPVSPPGPIWRPEPAPPTPTPPTPVPLPAVPLPAAPPQVGPPPAGPRHSGRADKVPSPLQSVPSGQTSYTLNGLNPAVDYCFLVAAVYSADHPVPSNLVCTQRAKPSASASR